MKNKKDGLEKMKKAYLDMAESFANETYEKELVITRRIFQQVKEDLVCKLVLYFYLTKLCFYIKHGKLISYLINFFFTVYCG